MRMETRRSARQCYWLPAVRSHVQSSRSRHGLTILELLTVTGILGVVAALILPAVGSAREAARRIECVNQLRQIGLALHNYHDLAGAFPPGWQWESTHRSAYGWTVPLLPLLDLRPVYQQTDRTVPLAAPANATARSTPVDLLLCPSDIIEATFTLRSDEDAIPPAQPLVNLPTASYVGVFGTFEPDDDDDDHAHQRAAAYAPTGSLPAGDGTFIESRSVRLAELLRGASQTLVVGERTMARVPSTWLGVDAEGEDAACRLVGNVYVAPNCDPCDECEFDSRHPGGCNFLWGDGRVTLLSEQIDSKEYRLLARRLAN